MWSETVCEFFQLFFLAPNILLQFWHMCSFNFSLVFGGNRAAAAGAEGNFKAHLIRPPSFTVNETETPKDGLIFPRPCAKGQRPGEPGCVDSQYRALEGGLTCTASPSLRDHTHSPVGVLREFNLLFSEMMYVNIFLKYWFLHSVITGHFRWVICKFHMPPWALLVTFTTVIHLNIHSSDWCLRGRGSRR